MDDRIRVSDADRDRVADRLRDHFGEGRLTPDELDERLSATLNAKTFGDLRRIMSDLPGPSPVSPQPVQQPQQAAAPLITRRRPRIMPVVLLVLFAALLLPGGHWLFSAFLLPVLVVALVAAVARMFATIRSHRRAHPSRQNHRYTGYGLGQRR